MNNYLQAIEQVEFLQEWDGKKGYRYNGVRVQTSNSAITNGEYEKAINTPLVKQLYQYANNDFEKMVKKGFEITHRLTTILFFKEKGQYYIASINAKTKEMTTYLVNEKTKIKESDMAIEIPLRQLAQIIKLQVYHY